MGERDETAGLGAVPSSVIARLELRQVARISVVAEIEAKMSGRPVPAVLHELSMGGARVALEDIVVAVGDAIQLRLPAVADKHVDIVSEVVRVAPGYVAVKFVRIEPASKRALEELLALLLSGSGGGRRRSPRVARRLWIRYGPRGDKEGQLVDIASGGLGMIVARPLVLGEAVRVVVPNVGGEDFSLRGIVVNQRSVPAGSGMAFHAAVQFPHEDREQASRVATLLSRLLDLPP